jgi:hypothetical protein
MFQHLPYFFKMKSSNDSTLADASLVAMALTESNSDV